MTPDEILAAVIKVKGNPVSEPVIISNEEIKDPLSPSSVTDAKIPNPKPTLRYWFQDATFLDIRVERDKSGNPTKKELIGGTAISALQETGGLKKELQEAEIAKTKAETEKIKSGGAMIRIPNTGMQGPIRDPGDIPDTVVSKDQFEANLAWKRQKIVEAQEDRAKLESEARTRMEKEKWSFEKTKSWFDVENARINARLSVDLQNAKIGSDERNTNMSAATGMLRTMLDSAVSQREKKMTPNRAHNLQENLRYLDAVGKQQSYTPQYKPEDDYQEIDPLEFAKSNMPQVLALMGLPAGGFAPTPRVPYPEMPANPYPQPGVVTAPSAAAPPAAPPAGVPPGPPPPLNGDVGAPSNAEAAAIAARVQEQIRNRQFATPGAAG